MEGQFVGKYWFASCFGWRLSGGRSRYSRDIFHFNSFSYRWMNSGPPSPDANLPAQDRELEDWPLSVHLKSLYRATVRSTSSDLFQSSVKWTGIFLGSRTLLQSLGARGFRRKSNMHCTLSLLFSNYTVAQIPIRYLELCILTINNICWFLFFFSQHHKFLSILLLSCE